MKSTYCHAGRGVLIWLFSSTCEVCMYLDELVMDTGGVARDMLSMFWESVYVKMFDGGTLLIPGVQHQVEMEKFLS